MSKTTKELLKDKLTTLICEFTNGVTDEKEIDELLPEVMEVIQSIHRRNNARSISSVAENNLNDESPTKNRYREVLLTELKNSATKLPGSPRHEVFQNMLNSADAVWSYVKPFWTPSLEEKFKERLKYIVLRQQHTTGENNRYLKIYFDSGDKTYSNNKTSLAVGVYIDDCETVDHQLVERLLSVDNLLWLIDNSTDIYAFAKDYYCSRMNEIRTIYPVAATYIFQDARRYVEKIKRSHNEFDMTLYQFICSLTYYLGDDRTLLMFHLTASLMSAEDFSIRGVALTYVDNVRTLP